MCFTPEEKQSLLENIERMRKDLNEYKDRTDVHLIELFTRTDQNHSKPSRETLDLIAKLQRDMVEQKGVIEQLDLHQQDHYKYDEKYHIEGNNALKEVHISMNKMMEKMDEQADHFRKSLEETSKRLFDLERMMSYAKGMAAGGKMTWVAIATAIGISWVVFGEYIKHKLGIV